MSKQAIKLAAWLLVLVAAIAIGLLTDDQKFLTTAIQVMMLGALATSWNIIGGFAGQISLGHAAFFGLGALITRELWLGGSNIVLATAIAVLVTAVVAAILGIPLLRFRDIYFSIGTLALGVAVFLTIGNVFPGITSLPVDALRAYTFTEPYYFTLGVLVVTIIATVVLERSKMGLGMMAVRDDEEAAGAMGVGPLGHKLTAFVVSAGLAALVGSAFAFFSVSYYPNYPFSVVWTFEALTVVFIGGLGTIAGPLLGAAFYVIGRDVLPSDIEEFQVILFGLLFILVVLVLPGGLIEGGQRFLGWVSKRGTSPAAERQTGEM